MFRRCVGIMPGIQTGVVHVGHHSGFGPGVRRNPSGRIALDGSLRQGPTGTNGQPSPLRAPGAVRRTWVSPVRFRGDSGGQAQGIFGSTSPLPPACADGLEEAFSTRSLGPSSASHSIPPQSTSVAVATGCDRWATGTWRTIRHALGGASNEFARS